jgi:outer membrane protein insertion porin family
MKNASIFLLLTLTGCSVAKRLPPGEKLFAGSRVMLQVDSLVTKAQQDDIQTALTTLARPKPNARILGWPYKVWFYYFFGEKRKETSIFGSLRRRFGEPPVLASANALGSNANIFANYLENEGYFRSTAQGSYEEKGSNATAVYQVQVRPRYVIDSVSFLTDSSEVRKALFNSSPTSLLRAGEPYRFDNIKAEQNRIGQTLKQRGFFYFQPNYVAVLADSAVGPNRVRLYVAIKPDMPEAAGVTYSIRDIYLYPNYSLNTAPADTNRRMATIVDRDTLSTASATDSLRGLSNGLFRIVDPAQIYDPRLFDDVISLKPGRRYNSRQQDLTLSRLINVGVFKFVRNRFEPDVQGDSAVLDVHYYLTPNPRKSIQFEVAGTSKSNNLVGTQGTLSWRNRNLFRRAELLSINLNGGVETQVGIDTSGTTSFRYGISANLTFPRLLTPFFRFNYDRRQVLPKTSVSLGYEVVVRSQLYNLNSANLAFTYAWRPNQQVEQTFSPVSVNFVRTSNFGDRFYELLASPIKAISNQYARLTRDQFILSTAYSINYGSSPRTSSPGTYRLTFNAETAGNLAGLLIKPTILPDSAVYKYLFGTVFEQYARADVDLRYYYQVNPGLVWANRLFAGVGIPYGNSALLPIAKQYFVGGSSSLRGFLPRTVGPGTFSTENSDAVLYFQDGGGDVKLEVNTELRPRLNKFLQGAIFVDAGNVWTYSDTETYGPGSSFSSSFLRQIAMSGGVGLRVDLSYFVVRADLAIPFRKPWLPEDRRWVFDQIDFASRSWRADNLRLNIAIGYPF